MPRVREAGIVRAPLLREALEQSFVVGDPWGGRADELGGVHHVEVVGMEGVLPFTACGGNALGATQIVGTADACIARSESGLYVTARPGARLGCRFLLMRSQLADEKCKIVPALMPWSSLFFVMIASCAVLLLICGPVNPPGLQGLHPRAYRWRTAGVPCAGALCSSSLLTHLSKQI